MGPVANENDQVISEWIHSTPFRETSTGTAFDPNLKIEDISDDFQVLGQKEIETYLPKYETHLRTLTAHP